MASWPAPAAGGPPVAPRPGGAYQAQHNPMAGGYDRASATLTARARIICTFACALNFRPAERCPLPAAGPSALSFLSSLYEENGGEDYYADEGYDDYHDDGHYDDGYGALFRILQLFCLRALARCVAVCVSISHDPTSHTPLLLLSQRTRRRRLLLLRELKDSTTPLCTGPHRAAALTTRPARRRRRKTGNSSM